MIIVTYWKYKTATKMIFKKVNESDCNDWNYKEHMESRGWEQINKNEYDLRKQPYTMEDLKAFYEGLKEELSNEEYKSYEPKENEEETHIIIGNEEVIINKQDNTVKSSMNNFNSIHEIVGELLSR